MILNETRAGVSCLLAGIMALATCPAQAAQDGGSHMLPREQCEPQSFQELEVGGTGFILPKNSASEVSGASTAGDQGPALTMVSAIADGEVKAVAPLYRCLLQQSGYGLSSTLEGEFAPFVFVDGLGLSGQVFIAPYPGLEGDFTRIVIIIQPQSFTGTE